MENLPFRRHWPLQRISPFTNRIERENQDSVTRRQTHFMPPELTIERLLPFSLPPARGLKIENVAENGSLLPMFRRLY